MALRDALARPRASTASARRLRDAPRTSGMTQKLQEKLQPSWILHERAHAVEPRVGLDAADRPDVAGDERRRLLAAPRDDGRRSPAAPRTRRREVRAAAR